MTNVGHFIDRCPIICAAGKVAKHDTTVKDTLREYNLVDQVEAVKHDFKIFNDKVSKVPNRFPEPPKTNHRGAYDEILKHLRPRVKTRYQQLMTDLSETVDHSYWKQPLGKTPDSVPGLPKGMEITETTFGQQPTEHTPLYEIILPNISRYQVLRDSQVGHENYKKIYNDYNPGEQIDRNYNKPPYNPSNCAGYKSKTDPRGKAVPCCMQWGKNEPITVAPIRQVNWCNNNRVKLGKVKILTKNCLPRDHTFGIGSKKGRYGVAELLKPGCTPAIYKAQTLERMASLNTLRQNIKKQFSPSFTLTDLFNKLAEYDEDLTNLVTLEQFYNVMERLKLHFNKVNLNALFESIGIIQSGKIDYRKFVNAVAFDMEFGKQLDPLPKENLYYCSETSAAMADRYLMNKIPEPAAAGLSSLRFDLKVPPIKTVEADRENLPTDDVKTLIERTIFLQYNISYRDMFQGRSEQFIKTLFKNCGYQFAEGAFDVLYKMALDKDKTGNVCVDTFYKLIKQYQLPMKKIDNEMEQYVESHG